MKGVNFVNTIAVVIPDVIGCLPTSFLWFQSDTPGVIVMCYGGTHAVVFCLMSVVCMSVVLFVVQN